MNYPTFTNASVTVFAKKIKPSSSDPFILEQPTADNDYTAKIYLYDRLPGYQDWEFELFYTIEDPFTNNQAPSWQKPPTAAR